jgi:hypothetical protein
MLRLLGVILVGATALAASAAPKGRVVRVERPSKQAAVPRFCVLSDTGSFCLGTPKDGDRVALIDRDRSAVVGELRIDSAIPSALPGQCPTPKPTAFKVTGTIVSGDPDLLSNDHEIFGLRDVTLDRRVARMLTDLPSPRGNTNDEVELAVDADGDSDADYLLLSFPCDAAGAPSNRSPSSNGFRCLDTYVERQDKLVRVHQDILASCF